MDYAAVHLMRWRLARADPLAGPSRPWNDTAEPMLYGSYSLAGPMALFHAKYLTDAVSQELGH